MVSTLDLTNELINLDKNDPQYQQKRMRLMVDYMVGYMGTYDLQSGYENYRDETFIDDILYGLGVALNPEQHQFADGFRRWKDTLAEYLKNN